MSDDDAPNAPPDDFLSAPRLFTLDEAHALLPVLTPLLIDLQAEKRALDTVRAKLATLTPAMRGNGHATEATAVERQMEEVAGRIVGLISRITAHGVEVKDLDRGLIDFPSLRDDRVVYLCWQVGEPAIRYWHEIDGGFAGRQPLAP
ncbi:MAG: DUF2203 domain-containing protein [Chloroflexota bacterium]|nr:DUF2203 domain-containing protein [Chloroflexota bacterium]